MTGYSMEVDVRITNFRAGLFGGGYEIYEGALLPTSPCMHHSRTLLLA